MNLLTAAQMREADRRTIEEAGIPARVLMENAGRAVAEAVAAEAEEAGGGTILILCGRGGNGGDGLVALRALAARGLRATAVLLADPDRLEGPTRENHEAAVRLGLDVASVPDEVAWEKLETGSPAVVVDAVLGVGSSGPLRGLAARVVSDLDRLPNLRNARRVAVDLPSGLSADSGARPDLCFRADLTVALAAPKVCHFVFPASAACGRVQVVEIGIPAALLNEVAASAPKVTTGDARQIAGLLPARAPGVHKGQLGRLLLVAGSRRMPGAAALSALGALSAGVGLLTVAGPAEGLVELPPEAMRLPLPAGAEGELAVDAALEVAAFSGADAIALGPGIGSTEEAGEAVRRIVATTSAPLVLDADGLNAFAGRAGELAGRSGLALTPHPGETARLLSDDHHEVTSAEIQEDRLASARQLSESTKNAVALKGPGTLIAEPGGAVVVNRSGGAELAAGGSGDVLTGAVGALLARGLAPADALQAAAFLHGAAGEEARKQLGEEAVTASSVAAHLGTAIRSLRQARP